MKRSNHRRLPRARRGARSGVAAVEFALVAPVLLILAGALTDFGLADQAEGRLAAAVASGADYAFVQAQANGGSVSTGAVAGAVTAALGLAGATATASPPGAYCLSRAGASTSLVPGSPGIACADGTFPGTYMIVSASYAYRPLMPLYSMLAPVSLSASGAVRLQ